LADRQGLLKGDLNVLQRFGLAWLMNKEVEGAVEVEKIKLLNNALAAHPATQTKYLQKLLEEAQEDDEEYVYVSEEDWFTPEGVEEIERQVSQSGSKWLNFLINSSVAARIWPPTTAEK
jgi:hypothetical protein